MTSFSKVSILYSSNHICGGGLISDKAVLTTAYCCDLIIDLNLAKVSVGSEVPISEDDDQNIVSELSKINSFPDFLLPVSKSSNYSSDLCLLILDHDMPNNDLIAPIGDEHFDEISGFICISDFTVKFLREINFVFLVNCSLQKVPKFIKTNIQSL